MRTHCIDLEKVFFGLLCFSATTIPLSMLLNNISIILLFVLWLIIIIKNPPKKINFKPIILLTIPYIILIIGSINTDNYHQLNVELTKNLPFLIFPIVVFTSSVQLTKNKFNIVLKSFILGNIIISLILLFIIIKSILEKGLSIETLWLLTHQKLSLNVGLNAIYLSLYIAISLIFIVYDFFNKTRPFSIKTIIFYLFSTLLFLIILIFLSSRTVILACFILVSIITFRYFSKKMGILKVLIGFIMVGGFLSASIISINPILKLRIESVFFNDDFDKNLSKEEGVQMRKKLWQSSFEVFKENYFIGVGTGDFKDVLISQYKKNKHRIQFRFQMNSHNQYLSLMVSNGILGLFLFLFYLGLSLSNYIKEKRWLLLYIVLLFIFCFMTESYLYTNKGVVVFSFFMTIMFKHFNDTKRIRYEKA